MAKKTFYLCWLFIFVSLCVYPEVPDFKFKYITVEDGLSQGSINCIFQDSRGFLWFGTKQGLNKYDGFNIDIFDHDPFDPSSLSNNNVSCVTEDKNGDLWVGTSAGLNKFDYDLQNFKRFLSNPLDQNSLMDEVIISLLVDSEGIVWIGTELGLDRFDPESGIFRHFRYDSDNPDSLGQGRVQLLFEDKNGKLWVVTSSRLNRFEREEEKFTHFLYDVNNDPLPSLADIHQDQKNRLLMLFNGIGLCQFDYNRETVVPIEIDPAIKDKLSRLGFNNMCEDYMGRIWFGTLDKGIFILDIEHNEIFHVGSGLDRNTNGGLSHGNKLSLYSERGGSIIIGTDGTGANLWHPYLQKFRLYRHDPDAPDSLGLISIRAVYEDRKGNLWIGGYYGLDKYDRKKGKFIHFSDRSDYSKGIHGVISVFQEDFDDPFTTLWIGTEGHNLIKFNLVSETATPYTIRDRTRGETTARLIRAVHCDKSGIIWIGTQHGLFTFDKIKETFRLYRFDSEQSENKRLLAVNVIYESKFEFLWIGTEDRGLFRLDRDSGSLKHYDYYPGGDESSGLNNVLTLHEDQAGILWIGTLGGGLVKLESISGKYRFYSEAHGLSNNVVYGILQDEKGYLWLSTNKGLSKFDPKEENFTNYGIEDGLQGLEFNYNAYYKSRSGEMFFGGVRGLNAFYPENVEKNPFIPPVVITDFLIFNNPVKAGEARNGKTLLDNHIINTDKITLSYKEKVISFEYAALQYAAAEKCEHAYILEGLESEWNYVGNRRFASYSNLSPGKYTFIVKAANNDGLWNETGKSIRVIITPPFYGTWWFRIIAIGGILLLILLVYELRTYSIKKRSRELEKINIELNKQIAERVKAEQALRENEERLKLLFDFAPDAYFLIDLEGNFIDCNRKVEEITGYEKKELIGYNYLNLNLIPSAHYDLASYLKEKSIRGEPTGPDEFILNRKDGIQLTIEIATHPVKIAGQTLVLSNARNISQRKKVERELKASLKEKVILLQEIHHRVKNNMQIISSLLRLQSGQIDNEKMQDIFRISQDRIRSMALIHDMLYKTKDFAGIDFNQYLQGLIRHLVNTYLIDAKDIKIHVRVDKVYLDLNTAVPCGLILNELVTNSLKHAFPSGRKGEVTVELRSTETNKTRMSVSDNGIGLPDDFNFNNPQSLGLMLVKDLVRQLNGKIEYTSENGASFIITF
jgi:PAS domain S-box-containing protein